MTLTGPATALDSRRPAPGRTGLAALVAAALVAGAAGARAQAPLAVNLLETASPACLAAVPESLLTRHDTLFVHAFLVDTTARSLLPEADLLAQRVAHRLRALLGGRLDSLPSGEPAIGWRSPFAGNVLVKAHHDGTATWQALVPGPSSDTTLIHLLVHALDSVAAHRELVTWSVEAPRDSFEVRLVLAHGEAPSFPRAIGEGFPALTLREPAITLPALTAPPALQYPEEQHAAGVGGRVVLRVTVDTLGHVEPGTVEDVWVPGLPRPAGRALDDYHAFSDAAHEALNGARFRPARLGGCAVAAPIELPFNFTVGGRRSR